VWADPTNPHSITDITMERLEIIEHDLFRTSIASQCDEHASYTVESRRHAEGWWSSAISRADKDASAACTALADVSYVSWGTTLIAFGVEGESEPMELDAFLWRRHTTSK
jgi:hypothetical protein